jgi:hypothetical protein
MVQLSPIAHTDGDFRKLSPAVEAKEKNEASLKN